MINNYICKKCDHCLVCNKVDTIAKFDSENKKYIGVDIEIVSCKDFAPTEEGNVKYRY